MEQSQPVFYERQQLRVRGLRLLVALPPAMMSLLAVWQVILGHPWGRRPMSNAGLIALTIVLWLVYLHLIFIRLVTELRQNELRISMRGAWPTRRVRLNDIKTVEVIRFNAIRDFRGYGVRRTRNGMAYIAGGDEGVRLELSSGAKVIIGSRRASELAGAIRRLAPPAK